MARLLTLHKLDANRTEIAVPAASIHHLAAGPQVDQKYAHDHYPDDLGDGWVKRELSDRPEHDPGDQADDEQLNQHGNTSSQLDSSWR
jgi:hypothetical protein